MKKWSIDTAHTESSFSVKHMGLLNVRGSFGETTGEVVTDDNNKITSVHASVQVKTITTRNEDRDKHLKTNDFLLVDKYPTITFRSTSVKEIRTKEYEVTGNLSIRGVTKSVVLKTKITDAIVDPFGLNRIAIVAEAEINRLDFGVSWSQSMDNGRLLVGNEVKIIIESEITNK